MKLLKEFVKFKLELNLQRKTVIEYEKSIVKFMDYIKIEKNKSHLTNQSIANITSQDVQDYALMLRKSYSINSTQKELAGIKQFFKYLKKRNIVNENPVVDIEMKKNDVVKEKKFMNTKEGDLLFELAQSNRDKIIIGLACYNGLRINEVSQLKISDINLDKNTMTFVRKNQKIHTLKISTKIIGLIRDEIKSRNVDMKLIGISTRMIGYIFNELCTIAGFNGEQYHYHSLRAVCASSLYEKGFNPIQIQKFLNHSSLNTTLIYLDTNMDDFLAKFEELVC